LTPSTHFDLISKTILFAGLPDDQIHQLLGIAREKEFLRNEIVFSEGDPANGFYVNADGLVKIYKLSSEGKEQILHIFGPGEPYGEVPVFSGKTFPAYAETITPSKTLFFPRQSFVELISDNPSLALNMLAVLAMRLRHFTVQIENLSLKEVPGRLAAYFLMLSVEQNTPKSVMLNITKSQLASFLGTIPETLSRMLNRMAAQNLIRVEGRRISLMDEEGLMNLAETGKLPGVDE
jgi:CRP/FNR family transcriptional regulator, dissimilatory nitrate respiration regulator